MEKFWFKCSKNDYMQQFRVFIKSDFCQQLDKDLNLLGKLVIPDYKHYKKSTSAL